MSAKIKEQFWLLMLASIVAGCTTVAPSNTAQTVGDAYKQAIADAALIEDSEIVALKSVPQNTSVIVTWTPYVKSYPAGQKVTLEWGEVWVTLDGDVKSHCVNYHRNTLLSDIQRLLGLPLKDEQRSFVTMEVPTSSMFRPCANPDLSENICGTEFPKDISKAHKGWYAQQVATSYQFPTGFPWTRLGYTYNWNPGASEVGPSEFVIKGGTEVKVLSVSNTKDYCTR